MSINSKKEKEWLSKLKKIENAVSKLLESRLFFREFMEIVKSNPKLQKNNLFIIWIWENYLLNEATAIRRLVDKNQRTISLYLLLEDIKKNPEILSRARYAELFKDSGFANDYDYINNCFDELVGKGKNHIDSASVEKDIKVLIEGTKNLKKYVNKIVAHLDEKGLKELPTIKVLDDAIDLIVKIVQKYYAIFYAGRVELEPVPQVPWKNIFNIPWST
jgi:hypothetical protein